MSELSVEVGALDLVRQLAERQAGHLRAIRDHLDAHTTLSGVGGAVMLCLRGQYDEGRRVALEGFEQGVRICENVAEQAAATRRDYVAADRAAWTRLQALAQELGVSVPPFSDPGSPDLGPPGGPAAEPGAQDDSVAPWSRMTPEALRPGVDGARTATTTGVKRIDAPPSNPFGPISLRYPADQGMSHLTDRYWDRRDEQTPFGSTSSARDRYEQAQMRRFAEGYDRGTQATGAGSLTHHSPWSQDRMTTRTTQAGLDVYGTVTSARGAWNAIERLDQQADGRDVVTSVATGRDNTANAAWAE
ncbi:MULTISPECIES: hypothetical protein [unclassified Actinotalea]|uniref:hypothetical protein n=1 Tax=unclassified Actinotalea TaxID=2638618 RepID=UPI0015F5CB1A|nr:MULTISPECIES: hypothetical protein [unclassified Actinotalea]